MMTSSELDKALWDKEDEIVQAFENEENDVEVIDRATSVDMSVSRYGFGFHFFSFNKRANVLEKSVKKGYSRDANRSIGLFVFLTNKFCR